MNEYALLAPRSTTKIVLLLLYRLKAPAARPSLKRPFRPTAIQPSPKYEVAVYAAYGFAPR